MKINKEEFLRLVRETFFEQEDIIKDYENDIVGAYFHVDKLPENIFGSGIEDCVNNRSTLMRLFANCLQEKYLYGDFAEALVKKFTEAGYIGEDNKRNIKIVEK